MKNDECLFKWYIEFSSVKKNEKKKIRNGNKKRNYRDNNGTTTLWKEKKQKNAKTNENGTKFLTPSAQ